MAKSKKRHPNSYAAVKRRELENRIADQKDRARKRMDPTARNILLGDLVYLAIISMLDNSGMLTELAVGVTTIIGAALIPVALYFQFRRNSGSSGGPRLK